MDNWTIVKRLNEGDEFSACLHRCRVAEIIERRPDYNVARIEVIEPYAVVKGIEVNRASIPPLCFDGKFGRDL